MVDSAKIPPVILVPYDQGSKIMVYLEENKEKTYEQVILSVDFDMVKV